LRGSVAVQAVARDVLVRGMMQLDQAGFGICLHIHAEIVSEVENGFGSGGEFAALMTAPDQVAADAIDKVLGG
jgi:hypothetical protein